MYSRLTETCIRAIEEYCKEDPGAYLAEEKSLASLGKGERYALVRCLYENRTCVLCLVFTVWGFIHSRNFKPSFRP